MEGIEEISVYEGHLVSRKINDGILPTGPLLATTLSNRLLAKGSPVSMNKRTYFDKEFLVSKTGKKKNPTKKKDLPSGCHFQTFLRISAFFLKPRTSWCMGKYVYYVESARYSG